MTFNERRARLFSGYAPPICLKRKVQAVDRCAHVHKNITKGLAEGTTEGETIIDLCEALEVLNEHLETNEAWHCKNITALHKVAQAMLEAVRDTVTSIQEGTITATVARAESFIKQAKQINKHYRAFDGSTIDELSESSQQKIVGHTLALANDQLVDQIVKELDSRVCGILVNQYDGHELTSDEKRAAVLDAIVYILETRP